MSKFQNAHYDLEREKVLANLEYFTEWGGNGWKILCRDTIQHLGNLQGKTILEIGPRFGKMSTLFALLGAKVVGVETNGEALLAAEKEVRKWNVQERVSFFHYNGDLESCVGLADMKFDFIFTKSVLVLFKDHFSEYLEKMNGRLLPNGQCIFLENRYGGPLFSLLRLLRPASRSFYKKVDYLTPNHLQRIAQVFSIIKIKKTFFPPIYLIIAEKIISPIHL